MGIAILGPVVVDGTDDRLGRRDRVVLTALAYRAGQDVAAEELTDALWPAGPPPSAAKVVQGCIVRLRRLLGSEAIATVPTGYRLTLSPEEIDAHLFEQKVMRARELLALNDPERAAYVLTEAGELWRGRPLPDLEDWAAGRLEANRLEELRRDAEELRLEAMLRSGRHREVLGQARALVNDDPMRERRWWLLALAQYQGGRQADALRTLHQLRDVLQRELALDPSPDVVALEHAILNQDPTLIAGDAPPAVSGVCPFQGLVPFDVGDAENFFGREEQVRECLHRLSRDRVLVVAGPSGCGKSSLVRAGVAAHLLLGGAQVTVVTPGRHPMDTLQGVRGNGRRPHVLVVDQLEELFTVTATAAERRQFLDAVVDLAGAVQVVLALRADRLGDASSHPGFATLVERGLFVLVAMQPAALRAAIEAPARQAGLLVEPGLVDVLVTEVRDEPGALPLLSHALRETWQRREGRTLTVDGYRASGGIRGSIAQSAEEVYQQVEPEEKAALRALMLRLVAPGAEGEPVRARVSRRVITEGQDDLVDRLVASRLVTSDADVVEVAHEALVRSWPRLREWLDEDIDGRRILHHLSGAAEAWSALGRPDSELYRGVRLAQALEWRARSAPSLTRTETEFLDAGQQLSEHELRAAEERARAASQTNRRLRGVLAVAVVLLVATAGAGLYAADQNGRANDATARARSAAVLADARRVGTRAQITDDLSMSLLLAVAGARLADAPETLANLTAAISRHAALSASAAGPTGYVGVMDASPDGRWIAAGDDHLKMHLYDARTRAPVRSYDIGRVRRPLAYSVPAFSPDGALLAVASQQAVTDPVRLLDPATMKEVHPGLAAVSAKPGGARDVAFSADGRFLAATVQVPAVDGEEVQFGDRTSVAVWDLDRPGSSPAQVPVDSAFQGVALSPNGRVAYTSAPLTAWNVVSGEQLWRREDVFAIAGLDISSDGRRLAMMRRPYEDNRVAVVDARTGENLRYLPGAKEPLRDVRFSHHGSLVAAGTQDGEVFVWDADSGVHVENWETFEPAWAVEFSADDRQVMSSGVNGLLRFWDMAGKETYLSAIAGIPAAAHTTHADPSPDGTRVAYRWLDERGTGWISFLDTRTGERTARQRMPVDEGPWAPGAWSPDGRRYVAHQGCTDSCPPGSSSRLSIADATTGDVLKSRRVVPQVIFSVAYTADGEEILVSDASGQIRILDAETLAQRRALEGLPSGGVDCCLTPLPGTDTVAYLDGSDDAAVDRWRTLDVGDGKLTGFGRLTFRAYDMAASPDGTRAAVAGRDGELVTIDLTSGQQVQGSSPVGADLLWVAWSRDGSRVVTGAADGGVNLWNARDLELLGTVRPPNSTNDEAASPWFSEDTGDVLVAAYDGTVYRWDTDRAHALEQACQMAGRTLTRKEWADSLPAQPYRQVCG